jgi:hypothetical protein
MLITIAPCARHFCFQWESFWTLDDFPGQVNIESWPVIVAGRGFLNIVNGPVGLILEPGEVLVR